MRLEQQEEARYPATPLSPVLLREARNGAHGWLARFAPLLDDPGALGADACRERIERITELRVDGERALSALEAQAVQDDVPLLTTLRDSLKELDGIEGDLRERLGLLAPGDAAARVDLESVRAKLAEAAARRELEETTGSSLAASSHLELKGSPANWGGAAALGVFAFGWLSFTTVHAVFMIGGMAAAFGWFALGLLGFYAIFYLAGLAMAAGAVKAATEERIELSGRELTLIRRFLAWSWKKRFTLARDSRAYTAEPSVRQQGSMAMEVAIQDESGKEIRFASNCPSAQQEGIISRINDYLTAQR